MGRVSTRKSGNIGRQDPPPSRPSTSSSRIATLKRPKNPTKGPAKSKLTRPSKLPVVNDNPKDLENTPGTNQQSLRNVATRGQRERRPNETGSTGQSDFNRPQTFSPDQEQVIAAMIENARAEERAIMRPNRAKGTSVNVNQLDHHPTDSEDEEEERDVSSDDSVETDSKSKKKVKYGKRERAIPPTLYWIGEGHEPTTAGRLAGSREKFADRRYLAKERLEELERICKGSMPTLRHAKSHLLLGFQLREARRLSYLFETLLARERGLGGSQRQDAEMATNEVFLNMQGALQIGIDAARHEIAMAEILSIHGEKVVSEVEGRKPRDSRFSSRTDWVLKEIKKDQVRDALIRQKKCRIYHLRFSSKE